MQLLVAEGGGQGEGSGAEAVPRNSGLAVDLELSDGWPQSTPNSARQTAANPSNEVLDLPATFRMRGEYRQPV